MTDPGPGFPSTDPLAARLFPSLPTRVDWGLERVEALLEELGDPHHRFASLHVGGTNGKASVASLWASVLRESGRRVGLYLSPELVSYRERFQIDGRPASEPLLEEVAEDLREGLTRHGLTFFEATTVLAFQLFAREEVDVALIEVGLGGRLDATNVVRPRISAVTNVFLDHQDYLGSSLAGIAREKAGIAKPGVPFLTTEKDPELRRVLREVAQDRGALFRGLDPDREAMGVRPAPGGTRFTLESDPWGTLRLNLPLAGGHQVRNAVLALRALETLDPEDRPGSEAVVRGAERLRLPGRLQRVESGEVCWLLDVAHNPAGVQVLLEALPGLSLPSPRILLFGVLADKAWEEMLPPLLAWADRSILTSPPSAPPGRRWDLSRVAEKLGPSLSREEIPDFSRAVDQAARRGPGGTVLVTGSHHTVGDVFRHLDIDPFPS